jgi:hypothetical protein
LIRKYACSKKIYEKKSPGQRALEENPTQKVNKETTEVSCTAKYRQKHQTIITFARRYHSNGARLGIHCHQLRTTQVVWLPVEEHQHQFAHKDQIISRKEVCAIAPA